MHKICEKGKKTMLALLNKVTVNSISDKPPLYWTNKRKGTVSQFIKVTRCIPNSLRIYALYATITDFDVPRLPHRNRRPDDVPLIVVFVFRSPLITMKKTTLSKLEPL